MCDIIFMPGEKEEKIIQNEKSVSRAINFWQEQGDDHLLEYEEFDDSVRELTNDTVKIFSINSYQLFSERFHFCLLQHVDKTMVHGLQNLIKENYPEFYMVISVVEEPENNDNYWEPPREHIAREDPFCELPGHYDRDFYMEELQEGFEKAIGIIVITNEVILCTESLNGQFSK